MEGVEAVEGEDGEVLSPNGRMKNSLFESDSSPNGRVESPARSLIEKGDENTYREEVMLVPGLTLETETGVKKALLNKGRMMGREEREKIILGGDSCFRLVEWTPEAAGVAMLTNDNRSAWASLGAVTASPYTGAVSLHKEGFPDMALLKEKDVETPSAPMEVVMEQSLLSHLKIRNSLTNGAVLRVLYKEALLMDHLTTLRTFFFMSKG